MGQTKKTSRELRKFGITMAVALGIFGSLFLWRDKPAWPYLYAAAGMFLFLGVIAPRLLAPVEWAWMKMAHYLGLVMTRVILTITFYLVVTPLAVAMKLFGRDPMNRKFDPDATTYWVPVDPDGPTSRPEKPY